MNKQQFSRQLFGLFVVIAAVTMLALLGVQIALAAPASCKLLGTQNLNLRNGPGTTAGRLGTVAPGITLEPLAMRLDSAKQPWFQVRLTTAGKNVPIGTIGWLLAGSKWLNCTPVFATLVKTLPATAVVAAPTAVAAPPPVREVAYNDLPGGGGGGGYEGKLRTEAGMAQVRNSDDFGQEAVFARQMYARMEVTRLRDNTRIVQVDFEVDDEFGSPVYTSTEVNYGYCLFGGGEPNCNVLDLYPGVTWPGTNTPILNGHYTIFANVTVQEPEGRDNQNWNANIAIAIPGNASFNDNNNSGNTGGGQIIANVVQTGQGAALLFQVEAYDTAVGNNDGAGIQNVDLWVDDAFGNTVYNHRENTAGYCLFGGGEPDCSVWYFADHNYQWPDGTPLTPGPHTLRAQVNAVDGRQQYVEQQVTIE